MPSSAVEHAKQVRHTQLSNAKQDEERADRFNAPRRQQDDEHVNAGFYDQMQFPNELQVNTRDESPDQHRPGDWRGGDRMGAVGFVKRIPGVTKESKLKSETSDTLSASGNRAKTKNVIASRNLKIPGKNTNPKNISKRKVSTLTRSSGKNFQRVATSSGTSTIEKLVIKRQPKHKENRQPATTQSHPLVANPDEPTSIKQKVISNTQARRGHTSIGSPFDARNLDQTRPYDDSDDDSGPPRPRVIHPPRRLRRARESKQHDQESGSQRKWPTTDAEQLDFIAQEALQSNLAATSPIRCSVLKIETHSRSEPCAETAAPGVSSGTHTPTSQSYLQSRVLSSSPWQYPARKLFIEDNTTAHLASNNPYRRLCDAVPNRRQSYNYPTGHRRRYSAFGQTDEDRRAVLDDLRLADDPRTGFGTHHRQRRNTAIHSSIGGWYRMTMANFAREVVFTNSYANDESNPFHEIETPLQSGEEDHLSTARDETSRAEADSQAALDRINAWELEARAQLDDIHTLDSGSLSHAPFTERSVQWNSLSPGSSRGGLRHIRRVRQASRGTSAPIRPWGPSMVGLSANTSPAVSMSNIAEDFMNCEPDPLSAQARTVQTPPGLRGGGEETPSPLMQTQRYKSMEILDTQGTSSMRGSYCAYEPLLEGMIDIWSRYEDYGFWKSDGVGTHTGSSRDIYDRREVMQRRSSPCYDDDPYTEISQMPSPEGIGSCAMEQQQGLRFSIQKSISSRRQSQRYRSPTPTFKRKSGPYRQRWQSYPSMRGGAENSPEGSPAPQRGGTDSPSFQQAQNVQEEQARLGEIPDDAPSVVSTQPLSDPTQSCRSFRHDVIGSAEQVLISDREQIGLIPPAHLPDIEPYVSPSEWLNGGSVPASSPSPFQGNRSSSDTPQIGGTDTHNMTTSDETAESDLRPSSNSPPAEHLDSRDRHGERDQGHEPKTPPESAVPQLPFTTDNHLASSASSGRRHGNASSPEEDSHEPGMNDLVLPDATEPQQVDDELDELYDDSPEEAERYRREAAARLALAGTSHLQSAVLTNDDSPIAHPALAHRVVSLTDIPPPWFERFGRIERAGSSCLLTPQKSVLTAGEKARRSPAATPKRVTTSPDVAVFRPALEDTHNGGFMEQYPRERARLRKGKVDPPMVPRGLYLTKDDWELGRLYGRNSDDLDRYVLKEALGHADPVSASRAATIVSENASTEISEHNEQPSE
ncbi:hypothetical protein BDV97DRAFT_153564 [Delphinella strobiligena]|nr:hypothetical protein BDV97DRAFT_153564 [Delphinella strobiligena]